MNKGQKISLFKLFTVCCYISALTVGGGYVIVPLMQKRLVEQYGWLDDKEMLDIVAISQSAPGSIAINASNLVGWKLRGFPGALVCVLGSMLPPMIIIMVIAVFYMQFRDNSLVAAVLKGMTAGVAAIVLDAVCTMVIKILGDRKLIPVIICFVAFGAAFFAHVNVVLILISCAVFGLIFGMRENGRSL